MLLTLGMTGMDQATEAALKSSFADASERLGLWMLQSEVDADFVVVDMDSMYGPMSWLRLHAAGKRVIGLTTAPRTQADYRLSRPFDASVLQHLLLRIAEENGAHVGADTIATAPSPGFAPPAAFEPPPQRPSMDDRSFAASAAPAPATAAAQTVTPMPTIEARPSPMATPMSSPAPTQAPMPPPASVSVASSAFVPPAAPVAEPAAEREDSVPTSQGSGFADWLRPGALAGRARFQSGKGPMLLIDFGLRQYFGPATLKPLAEYFIGAVGLRDFEQLDVPAWDAAIAAGAGNATGPQPLTRLQWFGALIAGEGRLLPGYSADGKFQLNKWPQTEREYPRHFRIATAMMKGPMSIADIVTASGVPAGDVVDFINASLITGFAEPAGTPPDAPDSAAGGKGSLLGRLRGR